VQWPDSVLWFGGIVVALAAFVGSTVRLRFASKRMRAAEDAIERTAELERRISSRPPSYVYIEPYAETDLNYLRQIGELAKNPAFQWLMVSAREKMLRDLTTAPPEERVASFGALWYHDYLMRRVKDLGAAYDALTAGEGEQNAEV